MRKVATQTLRQHSDKTSVRVGRHTHSDRPPIGGSDCLSECVGSPVKKTPSEVCLSETQLAKIKELQAKIDSWSDANPFKAILAARLAKLGGPHKPSTAADDRTIQREEQAVAAARERADPGGFKAEALELRDKPSCPFDPVGTTSRKLPKTQGNSGKT